MNRFRFGHDAIVGWSLIEYDSITPSSAAGWLYNGDTLLALAVDILRHWRSDGALVGY